MGARDTLMYQEAHESAAVVARQFAANERGSNPGASPHLNKVTETVWE